MNIKENLIKFLNSFKEEEQKIQEILSTASLEDVLKNIVVVNLPYVDDNGETFAMPTYGYIVDKFYVSEKLNNNASIYDGEEVFYTNKPNYKVLVFSGYDNNNKIKKNYYRIFEETNIYSNIDDALKEQRCDIDRYIDNESKDFPELKENLLFEFKIEKELNDRMIELLKAIDTPIMNIINEKYSTTLESIEEQYVR